MKLVAPQFVKPCVTTNKTDANDAEAICVVTSQRTAKANQLRELTYEYGLVGFAFGHCRPACTTTCSSARCMPWWAILRHGTNYDPSHVAA